jgi:putative ABC transport system substrate-binding protein
MRRREFIKLTSGAATSSIFWPLAARAQPGQPVIGLLCGGSRAIFEPFVASIHRGLKETGFIEGQNLKIEYRWADAQYNRLPALAKELVDLKVQAVVTFGANDAAIAAKNSTSTIPIVFSSAEDPIASGLVTSLSRPSGNLTGATWMATDLQAKGMEVLHELLPSVSVFGVLLNPDRSSAADQLRSTQEAADRIGKKVRVLYAANPDAIDAAFTTIAEERIGALIVGTEPLFHMRRDQIVALAARHATPTAYHLREFVVAGGLLSYGSSLQDAYVLLGSYTGRILKGAKPGDLPVQRTTKVELVMNLKTAKALGLTIPINLLGRADEVIE